jgi:hypothetical protein
MRVEAAFPKIEFPFSPNFWPGRMSPAVFCQGDAKEFEDAALEVG